MIILSEGKDVEQLNSHTLLVGNAKWSHHFENYMAAVFSKSKYRLIIWARIVILDIYTRGMQTYMYFGITESLLEMKNLMHHPRLMESKATLLQHHYGVCTHITVWEVLSWETLSSFKGRCFFHILQVSILRFSWFSHSNSLRSVNDST